MTLQPERSVLLPDVPTAAEAGLGKLTITPWAGFFGPANMPRAVAEKLSTELQNTLKRPEVKSQLAQQGFEGYGMSPDQFATFFRGQYEAFGAVVKEHNVKFD